MRKNRRYISLEDSLWQSMVYLPDDEWPSGRNPQDDSQIWAIREGIRRLQRVPSSEHQWRGIRSRKEHECIRGCKIHEREVYYRETYPLFSDDGPPLCAGCMAMILYYQQVYHLPVVAWSHWDNEEETAVWRDE